MSHDVRPTEAHDELVAALESRITELEGEVRELRIELWQSRDATIGATATAGSFRARNTELDMINQQLRHEIARLDVALGNRRANTMGVRLRRAVANPMATARRVLKS